MEDVKLRKFIECYWNPCVNKSKFHCLRSGNEMFHLNSNKGIFENTREKYSYGSNLNVITGFCNVALCILRWSCYNILYYINSNKTPLHKNNSRSYGNLRMKYVYIYFTSI